MNIDRENLKELFNKIIDIITNDYNIIFENGIHVKCNTVVFGKQKSTEIN